jgi:hypothetical protein
VTRVCTASTNAEAKYDVSQEQLVAQQPEAEGNDGAPKAKLLATPQRSQLSKKWPKASDPDETSSSQYSTSTVSTITFSDGPRTVNLGFDGLSSIPVSNSSNKNGFDDHQIHCHNMPQHATLEANDAESDALGQIVSQAVRDKVHP